ARVEFLKCSARRGVPSAVVFRAPWCSERRGVPSAVVFRAPWCPSAGESLEGQRVGIRFIPDARLSGRRRCTPHRVSWTFTTLVVGVIQPDGSGLRHGPLQPQQFPGFTMSRSPFSNIPLAPADPILGLTEAFVADTNPHKVNLG